MLAAPINAYSLTINELCVAINAGKKMAHNKRGKEKKGMLSALTAVAL